MKDQSEDRRGVGPEGLADALARPIALNAELRVHLDDDIEDRQAPEGWVHLCTVREVQLILVCGNVVELSLDSDLNGDRTYGQGYQVIDFLEEREQAGGRSLWPRDGITVHTANPSSRDKMRRAIETIPRRHPHLTVREDKDRPASQPHFLVERVTRPTE